MLNAEDYVGHCLRAEGSKKGAWHGDGGGGGGGAVGALLSGSVRGYRIEGRHV